MPNRILRDWTDSRKFDGISAEAERLFVRLLMKSDDFGRYHADPRLVKAGCLPLMEVSNEQVSMWLKELGPDRHKLVTLYEVNDLALLAIVNFRQRLKQSVPKFPPKPGEKYNWLPDDNGEQRELPGTSGKYPEDESSRGRAGAGAETRDERRETNAETETLGDGEWLAQLSGNPAYAGIDVQREYAKMVTWCQTHRKEATRRRFVNWLNRCDNPMQAEAKSSAPPSAWALTKKKEALEATMKTIKARGTEDAMGFRFANDKDRQDYKNAKSELEKVNEQIAKL